MVQQVLCVAEKPSIAKAVASHLSGNSASARPIAGNRYIWNYEFDYNFPAWGPCRVVMTSVSGHLLSQDFESNYRAWQSCEPSTLFRAAIEDYIDDDRKPIAQNIEARARYSHILFIWTDCDREGENIGTEIRDIAVKSNPRLGGRGKTVRARFSNIERAHVINAAHNPGALDEAQSDAVASRMELDLRTGAAFTRKLSLSIQPLLQGIPQEEKQVISYGSCQFPTLGFVVERYFRVRNFVPEKFWGIKVMHEQDGINVNFKWARNHLFDRMIVVILLEKCLSARTAKITKVLTKPISRWRPLPLTTVELQKCGSRFLQMDSHTVMQVAEKLYQQGWISYPRTETDQFDRGMNLQSLVQKQTQGGPWSQYAQGLAQSGITWPRQGQSDDKAHPPIHPVNFVNPSVLNVQERRVHEFVVRRFLACCSEDARGSKTEVSALYGPETFNASGLIVLERNYLDVYPYDRWTSTHQLPVFREGDTFEPTEAYIREGKTSPPSYLTEPELIALMDANGIGTDATMAEHIVKIKGRNYVTTRPHNRAAQQDAGDDTEVDDGANARAGRGRGQGRGRGRGGGRGGRQGDNGRGGGNAGVEEFIPTTLGVALVEGFENMGFDTSLAKPFLRREMELKMKAICEGRKTRQEVVRETIEQYRAVYIRSQRQMNVLLDSVRKYVLAQGG